MCQACWLTTLALSMESGHEDRGVGAGFASEMAHWIYSLSNHTCSFESVAQCTINFNTVQATSLIPIFPTQHKKQLTIQKSWTETQWRLKITTPVKSTLHYSLPCCLTVRVDLMQLRFCGLGGINPMLFSVCRTSTTQLRCLLRSLTNHT